jgi:hypothetical protein
LGEPVYPTKNGYVKLTNDIELKLDEADRAAELTNVRYSHDEVFGRFKKKNG